MAVSDLVKIGLGLALISTDVFTASALPDPSGEPEFPWMYWQEFHLGAESTTVRESEGLQRHRLQLDTKAMRKVKPGQTLTLVTQYVGITGTPGVNQYQSQLRVLLGT